MVPLFALFLIPMVALAQPERRLPKNPRPVLLLLHGRGQPGGQSGVIRNEWFRAIEEGLQKAGARDLFPESNRRFFWYADLLNREDSCKLAFGAEALRAIGWSLWPKARDFFLASAQQLPDSAKSTVVDHFIPDTGKYLENGKVACGVDDALEAIWKEVPEGTAIVAVAHSMGSIVLYKNLTGQLRNTANPVYLITIGSMIAQPDVKATILGALQKPPALVPGPVKWWRNIVNRGDLLAFPDANAFYATDPARRPVDLDMNSAASDRHSASEYLKSDVMGHTLRAAYCQAVGAKAGCASK